VRRIAQFMRGAREQQLTGVYLKAVNLSIATLPDSYPEEQVKSEREDRGSQDHANG
jgi:hypothetical protein